ncbi:MAG: CbtA family protein [Anaerolineales bacterium]
MKPLPIGATLKAALIAGVIASLLTAAFHFVITEPVIDQAIALEEQLSGADQTGVDHEAPIVSRETQRVGLVIGYLLYGLSWASLFGAVYYLAQGWLPGSEAWRRGLTLALLGYWAVALLPFLKYPANPPGVGDPATIGYRQNLYLGLLALAVMGAVLAVAIYHRFDKRWLPTLACLGVFSAIVYLAMPANPDAVQMPGEIVGPFRVLSLAGLTLFWAALGIGFGWIARSQAESAGLRAKPV